MTIQTWCIQARRFAGFHKDLEDTANGTERGYCLVSFDVIDEKYENFNLEFIDLPSSTHMLIDMNCDGLDPDAITQKILSWIEASPNMVNDSIIIFKLHGDMRTGRTSAVDVVAIRRGCN